MSNLAYKPITFRITEEDTAKFRMLADENGMSQAEMFQSLVNTYEMAKAKNTFVDRAKEIETFQNTVNTLTGMFINSLSVNESSEKRIRESLRAEMDEKEAQIKDLLQSKKMAEKNAEEKKKRADELFMEMRRQKVEIENLKDDIKQKNDTLELQQSQIEALNSIINGYKEKIAGYEELRTEHNNLKSSYQKLEETLAFESQQSKELQLKLTNAEELKIFYAEEVKTLKSELKSAAEEHKAEIKELKESYNRADK